MSKGTFVFFACLAFVAGVFFYTAFWHPEKNISKEFAPYYGQKVKVTGFVASDPASREKDVQFSVRPSASKEKILVTAGAFPVFHFGDFIEATGKLQEPPVFNDFNYRDFLAAKGIGATMYRPAVQLVQEKAYQNIFDRLFGAVLFFKHKFQQVIVSHFAEPFDSLLSALLLGNQGQMPSLLKQQLNVTGLRHITAISGQHIVIITNMLMAFLVGVGLWRKQAVLLSFACMVFFILLTGAEASAVRSGIMGSFTFLGQYLGRMNVALRSLVFAAAVMLFLNPLLLLHDVGFQLSFLAVLGIIFCFSFFQRAFRFVPEKYGLRDMIAMDIAAQVFTLPVLVYNFGYVSLVGIVANVLVLPAIPLLLGTGFLFLIGGALWSIVGTILSFPLYVLVGYLYAAAVFFSGIPFAALSIQNLPPAWLLLAYAPIAFLVWKMRKSDMMNEPM